MNKILNKVLIGVLAIVIIGIAFLVGMGYGEKYKGTSLDFTTQSVDTDVASSFSVKDIKAYKVYSATQPNRWDLLTSKIVDCPWANEAGLTIETSQNLPPKVMNLEGTEISFYAFSLDLAATKKSKTLRLVKPMKGNPASNLGRCLYVSEDNDLYVYSVSIPSDKCNVKEDGKGFECQ